MEIYLDGAWVPRDAARVSVFDHGLLYGDGVFEGITRGAILELAAEARIPAAEARLTRYDVHTADECFVCGTGAEVMPVTTVDGRPIGDGKPGPVTRRLTDAFHALVRHEGTPVW